MKDDLNPQCVPTSEAGTKPVATGMGKVYIVGAGPGDPELITVRGLTCLQRAEVVVVDHLVDPQLLSHVGEGTAIIKLAAHPAEGGNQRLDRWTDELDVSTRVRTLDRPEAIALMVAEAKAGKVVVRLKGGCPEIFARQSEELAALRDAGVPYEIVPGVTAASAAAAYAEIPLTDAEASSTVVLITGHEQPGSQGLPVDFRYLGRFGGTLVVYKGVGSATQWVKELLRGGCDPWTPVAVVCRASRPDQRCVRCRLSDLPATLSAEEIHPPAVIIVGQAVVKAPAQSWFEKRPLRGQRILVTRPEEASDKLAAALRELGAEVLSCPVIKISDPPDWAPVDEAIEHLREYGWVVFTSANGVRYFLKRLLAREGDLRQLGGVKIAAIGPGTAAELQRSYLRPDLVPPEYRSEALAEALLHALAPPLSDRRVLLVRANRGRPELGAMLEAAGVAVRQIAVYTSADVTKPPPPIAAALNAGDIDWVTVTSSSIARSLVQLFGNELRKAKLASISPVTSGALRDLGFEPSVEAEVYTLSGLVEAIVSHVGREDGPSGGSTVG